MHWLKGRSRINKLKRTAPLPVVFVKKARAEYMHYGNFGGIPEHVADSQGDPTSLSCENCDSPTATGAQCLSEKVFWAGEGFKDSGDILRSVWLKHNGLAFIFLCLRKKVFTDHLEIVFTVFMLCHLIRRQEGRLICHFSPVV
jgi:hypothetical protein